jgi:hypothetical protein
VYAKIFHAPLKSAPDSHPHFRLTDADNNSEYRAVVGAKNFSAVMAISTTASVGAAECT